MPSSLWHLPDGRVLEWMECGDPNGSPIVYFHGYLGSIHQLRFVCPLIGRLGLRCIAVNRPGVGKSTPHRYETMTEHIKDVLHLLDGMSIESFGACGNSIGGGYALACAAVAPERTQFVTIISSPGPMNKPELFKPMYWGRRWILWTAYMLPWVATALARLLRLLLVYFPKQVLNYAYRFNERLLTPEIPDHEEVRRILRRDIKAALEEPSTEGGLTQDLRLCFNWGFDPSTITHDVVFWHGQNDTVVPPAAQRSFMDMLPHLRAVIRPGSHFIIVESLPDILAGIAQRCRGTRFG